MATIADLEREVRKLKTQIKQRSGRDNAAEVSELVGEHADPQLNPTKTGWSNACAQSSRDNHAKIEEKAETWLSDGGP